MSARRVYDSADGSGVEVWVDQVTRAGRTWLQHRLVTARGRPGVVALALHQGRVLLVHQWRPATGATLEELPRGSGRHPAGLVDRDQAACADAVRELLEETGVQADPRRGRVIGRIWPDSGILGNEVAVVVLPVDSTLPVAPTDGEVDSHRWVEVEKLRLATGRGAIVDGITLAALALLFSMDGGGDD